MTMMTTGIESDELVHLLYSAELGIYDRPLGASSLCGPFDDGEIEETRLACLPYRKVTSSLPFHEGPLWV